MKRVLSGTLSLTLTLIAGAACTARKPEKPQERSKNPDAQPATDDTGSEGARNLRLKSADMIGQSLVRTLGRGKSLRTEEDRGQVDLLVDFRRNFGGASGLRVGDVYADSPSTAYILALGILADNAAQVCAKQTLTKSNDVGLCSCGTDEDAEAMLKRAMPQIDFAAEGMRAVVSEFAEQCKTDPASAITSLVSSLAFAAKI